MIAAQLDTVHIRQAAARTRRVKRGRRCTLAASRKGGPARAARDAAQPSAAGRWCVAAPQPSQPQAPARAQAGWRHGRSGRRRRCGRTHVPGELLDAHPSHCKDRGTRGRATALPTGRSRRRGRRWRQVSESFGEEAGIDDARGCGPKSAERSTPARGGSACSS